MNVADWRREATFRENDVDSEPLPTLTADDLKEIGVTSFGHRRRLLEAIAVLRLDGTPAGESNLTSMAGSPMLRQLLGTCDETARRPPQKKQALKC